MFDVGFFELAVIGIIALLVVGPERLPKLARTAGAWIKRARNLVSSVQQDIEREIHAEEIKKTLETAKKMQREQLQASLQETRESMDVKKVFKETQQSVSAIKQQTTDVNQPELQAAAKPVDNT